MLLWLQQEKLLPLLVLLEGGTLGKRGHNLLVGSSKEQLPLLKLEENYYSSSSSKGSCFSHWRALVRSAREDSCP